MKDIAIALHDFWNSFGIQAYRAEDIRIESAEMPYLIYNINEGETFGKISDYINIYFKKTQQEKLFEFADKIRDKIGMSEILHIGNGNIVIYQPTFQQREDSEISTSIYADFQVDYNI